MIAPGDDYSWYAPLEQREDEIGSHVGTYSALNVPNPQPGWHYYWCHYHARSNYSELTSFMSQGWQPVLEGEPEYENPHQTNFLHSQQNVDRLKLFGDVALFKIPLDKYRIQQQEQTREATQQLHGAQAAHEQRGEERARQFGRNAPKGRPLYYARADHDLTVEEFDNTKSHSKD